MRIHSKEHHESLASLGYRVLLSFYPREFRDRFGDEMYAVFNKALVENRRQSFGKAFQFLWREFAQAPTNIFDQYMAAKSAWLQPLRLNLGAFTLGCILICCGQTASYFENMQPIRTLSFPIIQAICYLLAGALTGFAIGSALSPSRKKFFVLSGSVGLLFAYFFSNQIFNIYFPNVLEIPAVGWATYLPLLYPLITGAIYGIFIALPTGKWHTALRCLEMSPLAFLAAYILNRLTAAMMQSYVFPGSLLGAAHLANLLTYFFIPKILEGLLLGAIFGNLSRQNRLIPVFH
jgi:hypothetical protein